MTADGPAHHLFRRDPTTELLGIELIDATPERASVRMPVRPDMCNGFGIIHGGMTFLLADSAMAFASNSEDERALATSATIDWLAPVEAGQTLTATAARVGGGKRSVVWDVTLTVDDGTVVARFRGRTRKVGGTIRA